MLACPIVTIDFLLNQATSLIDFAKAPIPPLRRPYCVLPFSGQLRIWSVATVCLGVRKLNLFSIW